MLFLKIYIFSLFKKNPKMRYFKKIIYFLLSFKKMMKVTFSKTSSFQKKNLSSKNVLFSNFSFLKKLYIKKKKTNVL